MSAAAANDTPIRADGGAPKGELRDYFNLSREYIPNTLALLPVMPCSPYTFALILWVWQHSYGLRDPRSVSMVTREHITPMLKISRSCWTRTLKWLIEHRVILEDPKTGQLYSNTNLDEWVGMDEEVREANRLPGGRLAAPLRMRKGRRGTLAEGEHPGAVRDVNTSSTAHNAQAETASRHSAADSSHSNRAANGTITATSHALMTANGTFTATQDGHACRERHLMVPRTAPMGAANGTITDDAGEQEQEQPSPTPPAGDSSQVTRRSSEQEDLESGDAASKPAVLEPGYRLPRQFQRRTRSKHRTEAAVLPGAVSIYDRPKITEFTPADPFADSDPPTDWRRRVVRAAIGYLQRYFSTELARDAAVILAAEIDRDGLKRGIAVPAARDPSRFADACEGVCSAQREYELGRQSSRVLSPVRALHAAYFKARDAQRPFPPSLREGALLLRWQEQHREGTLPLPPLEAKHHDEFERRAGAAQEARDAAQRRKHDEAEAARTSAEKAEAQERAERRAAEQAAWAAFAPTIADIAIEVLIDWHTAHSRGSGTSGGVLVAQRRTDLRAWDKASRPITGAAADAVRRAFAGVTADEIRKVAAEETQSRETREVVLDAVGSMRAAAGVKSALDGIPVSLVDALRAALGEKDSTAVVLALTDVRSVYQLSLTGLERLRDALLRFAQMSAAVNPKPP